MNPKLKLFHGYRHNFSKIWFPFFCPIWGIYISLLLAFAKFFPMPGENALQVHSNEQFAKEKPVHAKICWNTFTSPIFFALQIAIPVSFCYTSNHSNATFTCICSVTNHVPTPLNAAPLKSVRCQMLLHLATQKKSSNLVKFSTCQKKNLSTKSKTFFLSNTTKRGKKEYSLQTQLVLPQADEQPSQSW